MHDTLFDFALHQLYDVFVVETFHVIVIIIDIEKNVDPMNLRESGKAKQEYSRGLYPPTLLRYLNSVLCKNVYVTVPPDKCVEYDHQEV